MAVAIVGVIAIGLVSKFGQNVRSLFGAQTACFAGDSNVAVSSRARTQYYTGTKSLRNFASSGEAVSSGERYVPMAPNGAVTTTEDRLSTFAIDVDTASYALARRKILEGGLPNRDGVRVEEFLNYFHYDYPAPTDGPIAVHMDAAPSPDATDRVLLRVGLQAKQLTRSERKRTHLTFLVDVSGSMSAVDRLPLAQRALHLLVDNLVDGDTVGIVTYAGGVRVALPQSGLERKADIHAAIEALTAGGGTAMGDGITLAYEQAARTLSPDSQSRVIILSDGDANIGATSHEQILQTIAKHVKEGVTVSVVGFGVGNYRDDLMEALADKGNGNYSYVDSFQQAKRIFQEKLAGTLDIVAKDVKVQVEFDPAVVSSYRLVGYENRAIADHDFRNDSVDAGEIGSGHTVTAMYELQLTKKSGPLAAVHMRWKHPRGESAQEQTFRIATPQIARRFDDASADFRFATAVMGFAELLRQPELPEAEALSRISRMARDFATTPERQEFVQLVERVPRPPVERAAAQPVIQGGSYLSITDVAPMRAVECSGSRCSDFDSSPTWRPPLRERIR
jgi:Ca-activated chloride channel family protein